MMGISFGFAVTYTAMAVLFIWCASRWIRRVHHCAHSNYLIELTFLLQDNWYYVVGYAWEMFFSYLWFASLQTSNGSAGLLLLLDVVRAVLLTAGCTIVVLNCLPFQVQDKELARDVDAVRPKLRLLLFMTLVVIVVCAQTDVPTYFVTTYLATETDISNGLQILMLYAIAVPGVMLVTYMELRFAELKKPDLKWLYGLTLAQWYVSFLVWTPWKATVILLSEHLENLTGSNKIVLVVTQIPLAILITVFIAFGSGLVHGIKSSRARGERFEKCGNCKRM